MTELAAAVLIASGYATRYEAGIFDRVVQNRVRWGQLEPGTDPASCVALLECSHIGDVVWLQTDDGAAYGVTVCDCAARQHRATLAARGWAADLSPELAQAMLPATVRVWDGKPQERRNGSALPIE